MPAAIAPKAETLPKFSVAVLVPPPDESATPAPSLLKTRLMDELTVAFTVSVPVADLVGGLFRTLHIATVVRRTLFFILFSFFLFPFSFFRFLLSFIQLPLSVD